MLIKARAWQFLSRGNMPEQPIGGFPAAINYWTLKFDLSVIAKPFKMDFASVSGRHPSVGAFEFIDPYFDSYMEQRWPKCILADIAVEFRNDIAIFDELPKVVRSIYDVLPRGIAKHPKINFSDQFSRQTGYRRFYYREQDLDIRNNRRPSPSEYYHPVPAGAFLGPGLVSIPAGGKTMELVWSQVVPFPAATTVSADLPRLKEVIGEMRKHVNAYNEFKDARTHLQSGGVTGIKAAIRSAASGIDAILRFYCALNSIKFPRDGAFVEKIEEILGAAGMPSYRSVAPDDAEKIGHLYRARNSMHEGDIYFVDSSGVRRQVNNIQAEEFIAAAERFAIWIDALA